jgi:hypothetical protein
VESKAENSKVAQEYAEHRQHGKFILVWASREQNPMSSSPVCLAKDCMTVQGAASSALYWPADEVSSQTPGWLRPGDLSLHYTSSHISSICFGRNLSMSSLVRQVLSLCWIKSSRESSRRCSGGHVGHQLGQLGPLTGRRSSGRPDLLVRDGREPGRWGPRSTHVSQAPERGVGATTLERS